MATTTRADVVSRIGNTPMVRLDSLSDGGASYWAKLEGHNPFGSVKDRAAYWMIRDAEEKGILKKGKSIIIEPTSGNTGIALVGISRLLGYRVEIVIPDKASQETKDILDRMGAKMYETSDDLCPKVGAGTEQSIALATSIAASRPDTYYSPNQYGNDANFRGHYITTGPEIWEQTGGRITHFFTGVGTGGTITGIGTYLKEQNPDIRIIGCQPQRDHLIQGWRNFEESAKPDLFLRREHVVDEWVEVTNDEAFGVVREVLERDSLLISPSAAAVYACMKKHHIPSGNVVGIFADDGRKFGSVYRERKIFDDVEFGEAVRDAAHLSTLEYQTAAP